MPEPTTNDPNAVPWQEVSITGSLSRSSTASMIAALLQACGQHVGRLDGGFAQSPFDRLTVDGKAIEPDEAGRLSAQFQLQGQPDNWLERIADSYFRQGGVTWVVRSVVAPRAEEAAALVWTPVVGMGGLSPAETARRLLKEAPKAQAAVAAPQRESVLDVLRAAYTALREVAQLCAMTRGRADLDGQELRLRTPTREYRLKLPLLGRHQLENAATAILALEQLVPDGIELTADAARAALATLRLPGRLEILKRRPLILVDTVETSEAMRRLVQTLQSDLGLRRPLFILAAPTQADLQALVAPLVALDPEVIVTRAGSDADAPAKLAQACLDAGLQMPRTEELTAAVDEALALNPSGSVCIAGTRALIAAARAYVLGLMPPKTNLD